jgi:hypothetical protein
MESGITPSFPQIKQLIFNSYLSSACDDGTAAMEIATPSVNPEADRKLGIHIREPLKTLIFV